MFDGEARYVANFFEHIQEDAAAQRQETDLEFFMQNLAIRTSLFQLNASLNTVARNSEQRQKLADMPATEIGKILAKGNSSASSPDFFTYLGFFYNPVGKILLSMDTAETYMSYIEKAINLDANLSVVRLQAHILAAKMDNASVAGYVINATPENRNPYDLSPMQWDSQKRELRFDTPGGKNVGGMAGKAFIVKLAT